MRKERQAKQGHKTGKDPATARLGWKQTECCLANNLESRPLNVTAHAFIVFSGVLFRSWHDAAKISRLLSCVRFRGTTGRETLIPTLRRSLRPNRGWTKTPTRRRRRERRRWRRRRVRVSPPTCYKHVQKTSGLRNVSSLPPSHSLSLHPDHGDGP